MNPATTDPEVIWHDAECGAYLADLTAWENLCGSQHTVLDLGAGSGRVALHLAARGSLVSAVDHSPALLAELTRRSQAAGLEVEAIGNDVRRVALGRTFDLVIAPMQLIQLMRGAPERRHLLNVIASHLSATGRAGIAITEELAASPAEGSPPFPDVREVDGWIYSSLPLSVDDHGETIEVTRLRQLISPAGELTDEQDLIRLEKISAARLEKEAKLAGLRLIERIEIPASADHVGSALLTLERAQ